MEKVHVSVLLPEVLDALCLSDRHLIVDATLGLGGHSEAILQSSDFSGKVVGIDQDQAHLSIARERLKAFGERFTGVHANFASLATVVQEQGLAFDGILFDLGVASPHLDEADRGFSFQSSGPLDMRMNQEEETTAADLLRDLPQHELITLFRRYGDERLAVQIARAVVRARDERPLETTDELAELIRAVYQRAGFRKSDRHPAVRVFQALRIAVNREMEVLEKALQAALQLIQPGGRIVVISYHSGEDRLTKQLFKEAANPCICPPKLPVCACGREATVRILTRKPILPTEEECERNPRARSAKMRVVERLAD